MLLDLLLKYILTPERIFGVVWDIMPLIGMCLIFTAWKEKWWKCLMPLYGTYAIYKHTWQKKKTMFLLKLVLDAAGAVSAWYARKHVTNNVFRALFNYMESGEWVLGINIEQVIWCVVIAVITGLLVFVLTRITYMKVCNSLGLKSVWLKVGTLLLPEVFLIVDYVFYRRKQCK
ncbi:MAG: hypothetical protein IJB96_01555 [Lachnospira sp.]|nr:hypothetical protein [Lachnospira sp.]